MPTWYQGFEIHIKRHGDRAVKAVEDLRPLLNTILQQNRFIMDQLSDVLDEIGTWGTSWRDRAIAAEAAATAANTALQTFQDQDAADDATQLQAQVDADTALAQQKWDELQALDTPPADPPNTPVDDGSAPPVDDGSTPPVDDGSGAAAAV